MPKGHPGVWCRRGPYGQWCGPCRRLLEAAPDLLEAAVQAESLLSSGFILVSNEAQYRQIGYTLKTIRAALAKAPRVPDGLP